MFKHHPQMVEERPGSSNSRKAMKKQVSSLEKAAAISRMNKETDPKKRKSSKTMSPTGGRTITPEKKRGTNMKLSIGLKNCSEDDEDDIVILGETFVADRRNIVDDDEEKTHDVIQIDDSLSDEVEAEENDTGYNQFDYKNNLEISMTKADSQHEEANEKERRIDMVKNIGLNSSFEDDDIEILGENFVGGRANQVEDDDDEESTHNVIQIEDSLSNEFEGEEEDTGNSYFNENKSPEVSMTKAAGSSSFPNEDGLDGEDQLRIVTVEGIDKYVSEDGAESIRPENDSTESSNTKNDHSSDEDFDMDSSGFCAEESDEDYYPSDELSEEKREKRTTKKGPSSNVLKRSTKSDGKDTSTRGYHNSVYKSGGSAHGSKDESIDRHELKEMRTSTGNSQKRGFTAQESSDGSKNKSIDRNELKKMETYGWSSKKRGFVALESSDEVPGTTVILKAGEGKNANICSNSVDKTEDREGEISKKGGDLLKSAPIKCATKRRYSILTSRQIYQSSTSLEEGRNNSTFKNLIEKQSEDNHAKEATRNKRNAGPTIEDSVTKRKYSVLSRQEKHQSSIGADGRRNSSQSNIVSEKQSEESIYSKKEESAWFTKTSLVHEKKDKDKDFFKVLANDILREEDIHREEPSQQEAKSSSSIAYTLPLKFRFEDEEPKVQEKSDYENMVAGLFSELKKDWAYENMNTVFSVVDHKTSEASSSGAKQMKPCAEGKHDLVRNEEVGDICCRCHHVVHDSRDILPNFYKNTTRRSRKSSAEKENFVVPKGLDVSTTMENQKGSCNRTDGTVWSIIPGVRESMYKHQQDGFEFLWKNLAGTTDLTELKNTDPKDIGGCIISHAPGTGKTRLSIVFVQSYLRLFPDSRPVIIAPASMLLTWEEEFKKWEVEFPFHNLCNPEFSGKESRELLKLFTMSRCQDNNKVRWVKIFTWKKEKSIMGISYNLYEKLAGEKIAADEQSQNLRRILLQLPKLVILDEGHIPRNQSSSIWKTLLKLQTEKRIILSGTPFQNNVDELFNTLHLVRPGILEKEKALADMVASKLRYSRKQQADKECSAHSSRTKEVDKAIEKLKCVMQPFVHVHKGSILQKNLPGLTDCVILLDPQPLQKTLIKKLEYSENSFELGYKVALLSIHPSLAEHCWSSEYENSEVNRNMLKELRLDSNLGVKTKFIMALIQFSTAMNEKVLIFSQYIYPLELIKDQLKATFDWHEGKEVLQMQGTQDQLQRQSIISIFNNPNSEAKVLLAATKCCSEGISLVGASRVVLLDVVWNPSVERQAISRAYRLGQKKFVYTYHLITSGTNEADKYCRQAEKDRLSELVFSSAPKENDESRFPTTTFEDRILEKMVSLVDFKNMFLKIISKPKEANLVETFGIASQP